MSSSFCVTHYPFCSLQILDPYRPAFEDPKFQSRKPQSQAQDPNSVIADMATKFEDDLNERFSADDKHQIPPHRYLFNSYFYQYHLMQVCSIVIEMVRSSPLLPLYRVWQILIRATRKQLDEIIKLEKERTHDRLWTPVGRIFVWNKTFFPENAEQAEDVDPGSSSPFIHHFFHITNLAP